ncbi:hypothetical protein CYMTET_24753 [Cymbomonas tetramitiformis]|uniref:Uncharacterized protein n=1 Tax=Cymbomonas tetramitiformis TaxID=36881 RepID=A0AAE0KZR5_9CHLO|nr:hypothetical protein CYMTET_24753 [Cymbomonas tetramitiformis]
MRSRKRRDSPSRRHHSRADPRSAALKESKNHMEKYSDHRDSCGRYEYDTQRREERGRDGKQHRSRGRSDREDWPSQRREDRGPLRQGHYDSGREGKNLHTGDGHVDPNLRLIDDDPRIGLPKTTAKKGMNTESFDPESTFLRPAMRVIVGPKRKRFEQPLKHDDVVVVPEFFCAEDDLSMYYSLVEEMRELQKQGQNKSEWISWHEGCHLISQNPKGSPTYEGILKRISEYFNMKPNSQGTRFNWYRDSADWKPFHNDSAAYNPKRAQTQNITVGISFGATRELAFLHTATGLRTYFPQTNGMLFSFGRDVNINWKHGVNALPAEQHDGQGRISIVLWGLAQDVIEEEGAPPLLTNNARFGFDNRMGGEMFNAAADVALKYKVDS